MAVRKILGLGMDELRKVCEPVSKVEFPRVGKIVADLRDTLEHTFKTSGYGRAIAAPQIGTLTRVVYVSKRVMGHELVLINPIITEASVERGLVWDSCLCFISIFMQIERHVEISVEYLDLDGNKKTIRAGRESSLAELLQHEIDHLDGVLCVDRVKKIEDIVSKEVFEERWRSDSPYAQSSSQKECTR